MIDDLSLPAGYRVLPLEACPSTNDEAKRLAREGAPGRTVVWARRQTAGRGRWGRDWDSPRGNLYCSVILRPEAPPPAALRIGFAAGLAVADTLAEFLPKGGHLVQLKWPNDVLVDRAKLAGLLLESEVRDNRLAWLVVGIGINIAKAPDSARWPAAALAAFGARPRVEAVLERLVTWLDFWQERLREDGFDAVRQAWEARAYGLGEWMTIAVGNDEVTGRFAGLDDTGGLRLASEEGERLVSFGDIFPPQDAG